MNACVCETNDNCLLLYRSIEYGFELSAPVMEWLPNAVATVEATCPAPLHYQDVMLAEWLAQDVTLDDDDPVAASAEFWDSQDADHTLYLARTEEGGRWTEAKDGGLAIDRDEEDYTTLIRTREMAKKRELRDEMLRLGLAPASQAAWVKERITLKRQDAIREKRLAEKKSHYTEGFPLPSESQIRLRAYASCLASLAKRYPIQDYADPYVA